MSIIFSKTECKVKDIFDYFGHYPDCDFILHPYYEDSEFANIPDRPDLPLLIWDGVEAYPGDTSSIDRDFLYVTGNWNATESKNMMRFCSNDFAASQIWYNQLAWNTNKTKKFLFLNGKDVGHRRYIYTHLWQNNILEDSIYSYQTVEDMDWWYHPRLEFTQQDIEYSKLALHTLPHQPFDSTNLVRNLPQSIYSDTYCSIIGETLFQHYLRETPQMMFSEKTFSACANLHMFVVAGPYLGLEWLRSRGFETFGDVWDESYDTEDSPKRRLQAICNTIDYINKQDLAKLYLHCKDRLLHNQNLIYTIDIKSRVDAITPRLLASQA